MKASQQRLNRGRSPAGTPRWVYGFGIAFVVALAAFLISHLLGIGPMHGMHGAR